MSDPNPAAAPADSSNTASALQLFESSATASATASAITSATATATASAGTLSYPSSVLETSVSTTSDPEASLISKLSSLATTATSGTLGVASTKNADTLSTATSAATSRNVPSTSNTGSPSNRQLSGGALAGIAVGVILIVCIAAIIGFVVIRRRRLLKRRFITPSDWYEKDVDNPLGKPELVGTVPASTSMIYRKPELESTTRPLQHGSSSSDDMASPHEGGTGAPTEFERDYEEGFVGKGRSAPRSMEVRCSQTGEPSSPSTPILGRSSSRTIETTRENLNFLKAQERELAHKMEASESLLRLRAEHAALLDRIRIAEMREREAYERNVS